MKPEIDSREPPLQRSGGGDCFCSGRVFRRGSLDRTVRLEGHIRSIRRNELWCLERSGHPCFPRVHTLSPLLIQRRAADVEGDEF